MHFRHFTSIVMCWYKKLNKIINLKLKERFSKKELILHNTV